MAGNGEDQHDDATTDGIMRVRRLRREGDVEGLIAELANPAKDRAITVSASAARALGKLRAAEALDPLLNLVADSSQDVRTGAIQALGAIGDPRGTQGLVTALKDSEAAVRRQAAWALGAIGQ